MRLRLVHLYADLMNLYGDRGNILSLQRRCAWRQIDLDLTDVSVGDRVDPTASDIFFFGGGQDREQETVSRDLTAGNGEAIREAVDGGAALLAVCGGYQLLGRFFRTGDGVEIPGTGLFDSYTVAGGSRMVGNLLIEGDLGPAAPSPAAAGEGWGEGHPRSGERHTLVGFENHSGRTYLGEGTAPLGRVVVGNGNNGEDRLEGARYRAAIGTYLHGPALPKNPWLTDALILAALQRYLGPDAELPPLDDGRELLAHTAVVDRVRREGNVRTSIR
jgi:lipid II isoglutaminyl synthase (glutamine-hydrolysing)